MNDEGPLHHSGFDDSRPFSVTPAHGGVSLDSALREFGPAAIDDLIPRLRSLALELDEAHAAGFVHGRLHPRHIIVSDDATYLMGARVPAGEAATPEADRAALAAIAYEWMFGRPLPASTDRVEVRALPGVDRGALSQAFTRAVSPDAPRRFDTATEFVNAIANAQTLSLPLMAADDDEDPVKPFLPEEPPQVVIALEPDPDPDLHEPDARERELDEMHPAATGPDIEPVTAAPPPVYLPPAKQPERFSGLALILAAIVGAVFGFAGGYMARPRALQTATPAVAESPAAPTGSTVPTTPGSPAESRPAEPTEPVAPPGATTVESERVGRLLVRTTPAGADVSVDGVHRGVTPLTLRELDLGTREITVTRRGYSSEQRRVVLTRAQPSRSVEVRLSPQTPAAPRPSTPASFGKPAITTGSLIVDSLPPGAAVTVNGKPSGTTPLTIEQLSPGEYRVTMTLPGYRDFATTVRVVVGERARAAARLTEQEKE